MDPISFFSMMSSGQISEPEYDISVSVTFDNVRSKAIASYKLDYNGTSNFNWTVRSDNGLWAAYPLPVGWPAQHGSGFSHKPFRETWGNVETVLNEGHHLARNGDNSVIVAVPMMQTNGVVVPKWSVDQGETWTASPPLTVPFSVSVAYSLNRFIAYAVNAQTVFTSTNGTTWSQISNNGLQPYFSGAKSYVISYDRNITINYSTDLVTFTPLLSQAEATGSAVNVTSGGSNGDISLINISNRLYAFDGSQISSKPSRPVGQFMRTCAWDGYNNRWLAMFTQESNWTSATTFEQSLDNGSTWQVVCADVPAYARNKDFIQVCSPNVLIVSGNGSETSISHDGGQTWAIGETSLYQQISSIDLGAGSFLTAYQNRVDKMEAATTLRDTYRASRYVEYSATQPRFSVKRSLDGFSTWSPTSEGSSIATLLGSEDSANRQLVFLDYGDNVYASAAAHGGDVESLGPVVFRSFDAGQNWSMSLDNRGQVGTLVFNNLCGAGDVDDFLFLGPSGFIGDIASADEAYVYTSSDKGATWNTNFLPASPPNTSRIVLGARYIHAYIDQEYNQSFFIWGSENTTNSSVPFIMRAKPNFEYGSLDFFDQSNIAPTQFGLFQGTNAFCSVVDIVGKGVDELDVSDTVVALIHQNNGDTISSVIVKSLDAGATWSRIFWPVLDNRRWDRVLFTPDTQTWYLFASDGKIAYSQNLLVWQIF